jgi:nicotinamide-nucleotide amidase
MSAKRRSRARISPEARSAEGSPRSSNAYDLARAVGEAAKAKGLRIATAESCTGGLVAGAITDIAGSSDWLERGFVTYSNDAKRELLGVAETTLAAHGAVSEAVAAEMARGAVAASRADVAVAITGVAGPGGGTAAKPVGMVCFGWASAGAVRTETRRFSGDRAAVRAASVERALEGLLEMLQQTPAAPAT